MKKVIEFLVIFEIYLACFITCVSMLNFKELASLSISINFIIVATLFFLTILYQRKVKTILFLPLIFIIVFSLFSVVVSSQVISFNYLRKWIMFICTMLIYYCSVELSITSRIITALFRGCLMVAIGFIWMYFSGNHYVMANAITFNLSNPNYTGICILCVLMCLFPFFQKETKLIKKLLLGGLLLTLLYFIFLTMARACMIALVVFLIMFFFYHKNYQKWMSLIFLTVPLLFAIVYTELVSNNALMEFFSFMETEGKTLTSRVIIWRNSFDIIKNDPLLGNYYYATGGTGLGQLHNLSLDIMGAFGIVTFLSMTIYIWTVLNQIGRNITTRRQMVSIYAYYALMISGIFEAALFSNSQGMYVLSAGLLMIARYNQDKQYSKLGDNNNA